MSRARTLSKYPWQEFWAVYRRASRSPVTVPLAERTKALTLRGELHGFRRACEADPDGCRHRGIDLATLASVIVRIVPEGLQLLPYSATDGALAIAKALAAVGEAPAEAPAVVPMGEDAAGALAKVLEKVGAKPESPYGGE